MSDLSTSLAANRSTSVPFSNERFVFVPIGALMILTLQFQTLPLDIPIQTLPLTTIIALILLPFVLWTVYKTPLLVTLGLFFAYAVVHSLVPLLVDMLRGYSDTRFIAWFRQILALSAGVATFYVFRATLVYFSFERIAFFILLGSLPALLLSLLNILWGALGIGWAGSIVTVVMESVNPLGPLTPFRASGFATEPSTLATIIVLIVFPALFINFLRRRHLFFTLCMLGLTVIVFVWTFSLSGLLLFFAMLGAGMIWGPMRGKLTILITLFLVFAVAALVLFPNNQVFRHARSLAIGSSNLSFNDRVYGVIGPFLRVADSNTLIGYGLGGVSAHFHEIIPTDVQREILSSKWKEYPTISSLFGRTFAETGMIGLIFFLLFIRLSFWQLRKLIHNSDDDYDRRVFAGIRLALVATYASMFVSVGPYHTPYFWFWIAVIDAHYLLKLKSKVNHV